MRSASSVSRLLRALGRLVVAGLVLAAGPAGEAWARDDRGDVVRSLREYMAAYEAQDMERLRRVWSLSKLEAFLIEQTWEQCDDIFLSIDQHGLELDGDRARVEFDQNLGYGCERGNAVSKLRLEADLVRTRGGWQIERIVSRDNGDSLPAVASRGAPTSRDSLEAHSSALAALGEYQNAMTSCDLGALSRIWIMNRAERLNLEGFCRRFEGISVSVSGLGVEVDGDKGVVRFAQRVRYKRPGGQVQNAISSLRAALVRRSGGEWAIWSLSEN